MERNIKERVTSKREGCGELILKVVEGAQLLL